MSKFFHLVRTVRDIVIILLCVAAVAALATHVRPAHAETFENKDTAVNRRDNTFGTPAAQGTDQGTVTFGHDDESETMGSTPPPPKPERDYYDNMVITVNPGWPTTGTATTPPASGTTTGSTTGTTPPSP